MKGEICGCVVRGRRGSGEIRVGIVTVPWNGGPVRHREEEEEDRGEEGVSRGGEGEEEGGEEGKKREIGRASCRERV